MDDKKQNITVFDKIMKAVGWLQNIFSVAPLIAMCFIVLASVIMRYALKIPFTWGEEAARYLMIFAAMLAIGMGVREKSHLGVTIFTDLLPQKVKSVVTAFSQLLCIGIYVLLTYLSWLFISAQYKFGQFSAALKLPMYLVYGMMLLGFGFSCIEAIYVFWRDFIRKEPLETKEEVI